MPTTWSDRIKLALAAVIMLALAYFGLVDGVNELSSGTTLGQRIATGTQFAYCLFGIASLAAIVAHHSSARRLMIGWALMISATSALAPVVWGGSSVLTGVLSGAAGALIAVFVMWLAQPGFRRAAAS